MAHIRILLFFMVMCNIARAVPVIMDMSNVDTVGLYTTFGKNKVLPKGYEKQTLIALSFYPELIDTKIEFLLVDDIVPLATMPKWWQVFMTGKNRTYLILISYNSNKLLTPILLENLTYNAQIGVLGHELSHVVEFQGWSFIGFFKHVFMNLSSRYVDEFEYNTDKRCIDHALGYQLKAWSVDTRKKLDLTIFMSKKDIESGRERYMNPETIDKFISTNSIYSK